MVLDVAQKVAVDFHVAGALDMEIPLTGVGGLDSLGRSRKKQILNFPKSTGGEKLSKIFQRLFIL
jgi:hypothetical protein